MDDWCDQSKSVSCWWEKWAPSSEFLPSIQHILLSNNCIIKKNVELLFFVYFCVRRNSPLERMINLFYLAITEKADRYSILLSA